MLYVRDRLNGEGRVVIDPNAWSADGATALDAWEPSRKGNRLAYSVQDGGSDWRTVRFVDVASGRPLPDELRWVKYSGIAWVGEEGVLYSRFPESQNGPDFHSANYGHAVWYHRIGTSQSADELVFSTPEHPERNHSAEVTADGRWAVIVSSEGTDPRHAIRVVDLRRRAERASWSATSITTGSWSTGSARGSGSSPTSARRVIGWSRSISAGASRSGAKSSPSRPTSSKRPTSSAIARSCRTSRTPRPAR